MKKLEKIMYGIINNELLARAVKGFSAGAVGFGAMSWAICNAGYGLAGFYAKECSLEKLDSAEQFELALVSGLAGGLFMAGMFSVGYGIECLTKKWDEKKMRKWAKENPGAVEHYSKAGASYISKVEDRESYNKGEYKEKKIK